MEKVYTVEEAAQQLRTHPETIRRYLKAGKMHGFKVGRDWRVTENDLQSFIDQARAKRTEPTPAP